MKKHLSILILVATSLLFLQWRCGVRETEIMVENYSRSSIDSVILYANSYKCKFENIKTGKSIVKKLPLDSIDTKHDVSLVPHIYIKDSAFSGNYYYNDLGGIFKKGKFVIGEDFSTRWVIIEH